MNGEESDYRNPFRLPHMSQRGTHPLTNTHSILMNRSILKR